MRAPRVLDACRIRDFPGYAPHRAREMVEKGQENVGRKWRYVSRVIEGPEVDEQAGDMQMKPTMTATLAKGDVNTGSMEPLKDKLFTNEK